MVTVVVAATGDVVIMNVPVKLLAGASDGRRHAGHRRVAARQRNQRAALRRAGAQDHRPLELLPPTTVDGLVSSDVDSAGGGGAASGVKLRDRGPRAGDAGGIHAAHAPEVRRGRQAAGRIHQDVVTFCCSRTSGAVKALESSI